MFLYVGVDLCVDPDLKNSQKNGRTHRSAPTIFVTSCNSKWLDGIKPFGCIYEIRIQSAFHRLSLP